MTILRKKYMEQEVKKGMFTGKAFNTVAREVVGKWAILVVIAGYTVCGIGETEEKAIEDAKVKQLELSKEF